MNTKLLTVALFLFLSQIINAQKEGKITYTQTIKLDLHFEGMDQAMMDMIPKSQSLEKELLFSGNQSLFQSKKGEALEDLNMSSDDGSFQIKIMMDDEVEDILYIDSKEKSKVHQRGIMGKPFLVVDECDKIKWKITNEKVKYLDYECQKAVWENEDDFVIAWFTSQIPVQVGPSEYYGLPGAILMVSVNDGESEYKANNIDFSKLDEGLLVKPSKGKEVNEEEYVKIQKEKEDEMKKMYKRSEVRTIGQ